MPTFELKNVDPEDIEEVLALVQHSFNLRFEDNELAHITTFGQLCDYITAKIPLDHNSSCTSQQAFYKLRSAFADALPPSGGRPIAPTTLLADLLPRLHRPQAVRQIEHRLGFQLNLLGPPDWLIAMLLFSSLASLVSLPFSWQAGLAGITLSILGFQLTDRFASNMLRLQTVGQAAEQLTRENYLLARRHPNTVNRAEVATVLTDLFSTSLSLDKALLTREARFV